MKKYIFMLCSLFAWAGCSEKDDIHPQVKEELRIGAGFETIVSSEVKPATRADEDFTKDFYLYITQGSTTTRNSAYKKANPNTFGVKEEDTENIIYWDDIGGRNPIATLDLIGIYPKDNTQVPAGDKLSAKFNWKIEADQETKGLTSSDLLISNRIEGYTLDGQKAEVENLTFRHVLSKITIELKAGTTFTEHFAPQDIEILNMSTTANVQIGLGTEPTVGISGLGAENAIIIPKQQSPYIYEAIVFPGQKFKNGTHFMEFTITINGQPNVYKVMLPADSGFTDFEQGKNHKFIVTVEKIEASVTATVAKWDSTPDPINAGINIEYGGENPASTGVNDKARLYIAVSGDNKQNRVYNYVDGAESNKVWKAFENPIYWDEIKYGSEVDIFATLINAETGTVAENIYEGKAKPTFVGGVLQKNLTFSVSHPFARVTVKIRSEIESIPSGSEPVVYVSDAVDLSEIKNFTLWGFQKYKSIELDPESEDYRKITYSDPNVIETIDNVSLNIETLEEGEDGNKKYYVIYEYPYDLYLKPYTITTKGTKYLTVHQERDGGIKNDYVLKTDAANFKFEANKTYTITITLRKTDVSYKVEVKSWDSGKDHSGTGTIED